MIPFGENDEKEEMRKRLYAEAQRKLDEGILREYCENSQWGSLKAPKRPSGPFFLRPETNRHLRLVKVTDQA